MTISGIPRNKNTKLRVRLTRRTMRKTQKWEIFQIFLRLNVVEGGRGCAAAAVMSCSFTPQRGWNWREQTQASYLNLFISMFSQVQHFLSESPTTRVVIKRSKDWDSIDEAVLSLSLWQAPLLHSAKSAPQKDGRKPQLQPAGTLTSPLKDAWN